MGNWNQDAPGLTDEDMDQSIEQDKAAAAFEAAGGDIGGYTFGGNYLGDGNYSPQVKDIATARANIAGLQNFYSGALPQSAYNGIMGITPKNPYGHQGFFSRVIGIDPRNIDYATGPGGLGYKTAAKVAQKKYERYTNWAGQNPQAQKQAFGSLFGNPVGELTAAGPVAQQVDLENIPLGDALAVQAATFGLGPLGYGLMSMADPFSTYVPTGSKAYNEQFDPAINKDLPTSVMGQASSRTGLGLSSLGKSIGEYFASDLPAQTKVGIESLKDWSEGRAAAKEQAMRDAVSSVMSQAQTSPSIANMSLEDKKTAIRELADQNYQSYKDKMPDISDQLSSGYNFYGDPDAGASYPKATIGEQLAMGFRASESGYTADFQDKLRGLIERGDPFVQQGEENMYGTEVPDLMERLDQYYNRTSSLPAGSFDVADSGGRTYQSGYQGQGGIYSPGGKGQTYYGGQQDKPFFDKFGTTAQEALDKLYGYVTG